MGLSVVSTTVSLPGPAIAVFVVVTHLITFYASLAISDKVRYLMMYGEAYRMNTVYLSQQTYIDWHQLPKGTVPELDGPCNVQQERALPRGLVLVIDHANGNRLTVYENIGKDAL